MNRVVIVIPVFKERLNYYEEISILQCKKIFGNYPIRLLNPNQLNLNYYYKLFYGHPDIGNKSFASKFFHSPQTYNKFLKAMPLYKALKEYDFFLMYHTDAFVFKDELNYWMDKGYDNIGAPIYEYDKTIAPRKYLGVGNSGFSLHKIHSSLNILKSFRKVYQFSEFLEWYRMYNLKGRIKHFPYFSMMAFGLAGWSHHLFNFSKLNEDIFWGIQVPGKFKDYRVAPFEDAYKFSMEYNCKELMELNEGRLPFGCHQWYKGDFLNFWRDKIEAQGYSLKFPIDI